SLGDPAARPLRQNHGLSGPRPRGRCASGSPARLRWLPSASLVFAAGWRAGCPAGQQRRRGTDQQMIPQRADSAREAHFAPFVRLTLSTLAFVIAGMFALATTRSAAAFVEPRSYLGRFINRDYFAD